MPLSWCRGVLLGAVVGKQTSQELWTQGFRMLRLSLSSYTRDKRDKRESEYIELRVDLIILKYKHQVCSIFKQATSIYEATHHSLHLDTYI